MLEKTCIYCALIGLPLFWLGAMIMITCNVIGG